MAGEESKKVGALIDELAALARNLGATDAVVIAADDIAVEDDLAALCREPGCENYGVSASCPPHVAGPDGFRKLLKNYRWAMVVKIDVPSEILLSDQRREVFELLHTIVAGVGQAAVEKGLSGSKAFAGGSCKQIFCRDFPGCSVVTEGGACRNPENARPSMSGFGINVSKLMQSAGWILNRAARKAAPGSASMASVSGLVLIG